MSNDSANLHPFRGQRVKKVIQWVSGNADSKTPGGLWIQKDVPKGLVYRRIKQNIVRQIRSVVLAALGNVPLSGKALHFRQKRYNGRVKRHPPPACPRHMEKM